MQPPYIYFVLCKTESALFLPLGVPPLSECVVCGFHIIYFLSIIVKMQTTSFMSCSLPSILSGSLRNAHYRLFMLNKPHLEIAESESASHFPFRNMINV